MIYRSIIDTKLLLVNYEANAALEARLFPVYRACVDLELLLKNVDLRAVIDVNVLPVLTTRTAIEMVLLDFLAVGFYKDSGLTLPVPGCEVLVGTGNSQSYIFLESPAAVYHDGYKDLGVTVQGRMARLSYPVKTGDYLTGVPTGALTTSDSTVVNLYLNQAGLYVTARDPHRHLPLSVDFSVDESNWDEFRQVTGAQFSARPITAETDSIYDELIEVVAVEVVNELNGVSWTVENGQLGLDYTGDVSFTDTTGSRVTVAHAGGTIGGAYVTRGLVAEISGGRISFNITASCLLINKVGVTTQRLLGVIYDEIDLTPGTNPTVT